MPKKPKTLPPPLLGSHMSIAGGVDKSPARAASIACTAMQIFVKNNRSWKGTPITDAQAAAFAEELEKASLPPAHVFAHATYLINLASPKEDVEAKSIEALTDELCRCEQLGLPGLVLHPGAGLTQSRDEAIDRVARNAKKVLAACPHVRTRLLFETTAGTGTNLGGPFEDLSDLLAAIDAPDRLGICLDTCHIFAAGYDIRTPETYAASIDAFDRLVGLKQLRAIHLNDSKHPLGSKKDRHEHIGQGEIGRGGFLNVMQDPRLRAIPMSLETDKEDDLAEDVMNMKVLMELAAEGAAA